MAYVKEDRRAYNAAYQVAHRDEIRVQRADYYSAHRDEIHARVHGHAERMQGLRSALTCGECGGAVDLWHHVDPGDKRRDVGNMYSYSLAAVEAELEKCVPMCSPCHTRLHKTQAATQ